MEETTNAAPVPQDEQTANGNSPADMGQSVDRIGKLEASIGKLFAGFRTLERKLTETSNPKTIQQTQQETEAVTLKEQFAKMQADMRAEKEELKQQQKLSSIQTAISSYGIDSDNAEILEAFVLQKYGANIRAENKTTIYEDPITGEQLPVKDFIGSVLKSKGDRFRPPVAVPNSRGLRAGGNSTGKAFVPLYQMSPEDRAKLSPSQKAAILKQEKEQG